MPHTLVIVESPAKAKTIEGYLGKGYKVLASYGHVRDLIPKTGAVEPEAGFKMHYSLVEKNKNHVDTLVKTARACSSILLATDQDREGEAISWHIKEYLTEKKLLKDKQVQRIVFNQITKRAVQEALENPRDLLQPLVDAQQARRCLDYLVGFNLSPLLWKKIRTGLSAGRVQSPALRMIVEREESIQAFKTQEYWSIAAQIQVSEEHSFNTKLVAYKGKKLAQFDITDAEQAEKIEKAILKKPKKSWIVQDITEKTRKKEPPPPFITSSLLQESVKKLFMSSARTMRAAQQLYEGIQIDGNQVGLITYMRTDSYHLAQEAVDGLRNYIQKQFGKDYLPASPRRFKSSSKNDQEAHEAIRPADMQYTPDSLRAQLSDDQYKLYKMIWQRTCACQMQPAIMRGVRVDVACKSDGELATFRANGNTVEFPGFLKAYQEGKEEGEQADTDETYLPALKPKQDLELRSVTPKQHFTEPPARFTEASLIKNLKEHDIGRPSTYASIISTLKDRGYVTVDNKKFVPTDVGTVVNRFLTSYFMKYIDYEFTADLENELDSIARGEREWTPVMHAFWTPFSGRINEIETTVQRKDVTEESTDETCPECSSALVIKLGRNGKFMGCSKYPDCNFTKSLNDDEDDAQTPNTIDRKCPKCSADLAIKQGRYGKFIGCTAYPNCKHIESLNKPEDTKVTCPECSKGTLLKRRARKGNFFYSCSAYPKCKYLQSYAPVESPCPHCSFPITMLKVTKKHGEQRVCPKCKEEATGS